jgi:hypothetical protein
MQLFHYKDGRSDQGETEQSVQWCTDDRNCSVVVTNFCYTSCLVSVTSFVLPTLQLL